MVKKPRLRLTIAELAQIKTLRASGMTCYAVAQRLGRSHHTIAAACRKPEMATEIEKVKDTLADRFENVAVRMLTAISDSDIKALDGYKKTLSAAISIDKMRLLREQSTENIALHTIVEEVERDERERRARERREEAAQEGTVPQTVP